MECVQPGHKRRNLERALVQWQCWIFVASWTGVIKYHGPRPAQVASLCYAIPQEPRDHGVQPTRVMLAGQLLPHADCAMSALQLLSTA